MKVHGDHRQAIAAGLEHWRLPVFERLAIVAGNFGDDPRLGSPVTWLQDSASPVLAGIRLVPVTAQSGQVVQGAGLPTAVIKAESADPGALADPTIADLDYSTSVLEVRTQISGMVIAQADPFALDLLEGAQREAIRQLLLKQVLVGTGVAPELDGLVNTTNTTDYAQLDRGQDEVFLATEDALEDQGADMASVVWVLGRDLHTSASRAIAEPGDGARTVERGRIRLTNTRVYRSGLLPATTGIAVDLSSVSIAAQNLELLVIDRVTRPGDIFVTRQAFLGLIASRAAHVRRIIQS